MERSIEENDVADNRLQPDQHGMLFRAADPVREDDEREIGPWGLPLDPSRQRFQIGMLERLDRDDCDACALFQFDQQGLRAGAGFGRFARVLEKRSGQVSITAAGCENERTL
jgi:hypothetical protein